MSLLNDALRAAEQRQGKPAPSAYTGQPVSTRARGGRLGLMTVALVLVLAVGAAGYLYLWPDPAPAPAPRTADVEEQVRQAPVDNGQATEASQPASPSDQAAPLPLVAEPVTPAEPAQQETAPAVPEPELSAVEGPERNEVSESSPAPEPDRAAGSGQQAPAQEQAEAASPQVAAETLPQADSEPAVAAPQSRTPATPEDQEGKAADEPEGQMSRQRTTASAANDVKQPRQSPEQKDRDTARQIRQRLARGERPGAERLASELATAQDAPRSRYALARGLLARGEVDSALEWVPEDLAADYPDLRLIRARAILAAGDLERAVATLQQQVPPVADNAEYRVTLATLLEQQGRSDQAANHWAQLIAWDDSRAPWWVGLAIALESRGDADGAVRAYQQAAELPGLAPSLADYVRQRLQSLGAG